MSYQYHEALGEIIDAEDGQLIATTSVSCTPEQGNLLAAAPDLLAALKYVVLDLELRAKLGDKDCQAVVAIGNGAYMQAKSAISKATEG